MAPHTVLVSSMAVAAIGALCVTVSTRLGLDAM